MGQSTERAYFEARRIKSEEMARTASDSGVARIHKELAALYAAKLTEADPRAAK